MPQRLEEFGKVEVFRKDENVYEFKIGKGFSASMDNVLKFMEVAQKIAGKEYVGIVKFFTDNDLCHLILAKKKQAYANN